MSSYSRPNAESSFYFVVIGKGRVFTISSAMVPLAVISVQSLEMSPYPANITSNDIKNALPRDHRLATVRKRGRDTRQSSGMKSLRAI
jgi:hypothetical protein